MELARAVGACIELSPKGDCSNGPHGLIGDCDVSSVTNMSDMFVNVISLNGDISEWDVSSMQSSNFSAI